MNKSEVSNFPQLEEDFRSKEIEPLFRLLGLYGIVILS